jgi:hypothetical protein
MIEGIRYNCVEQYMMSRKALLFNNTDIFKNIMEASDPDEIKGYPLLPPKGEDLPPRLHDATVLPFRGN